MDNFRDYRDRLDNVRKPLTEAESLPGWCYQSEEFYQKECELVFTRSWQFVGRIDEISNVGDYLCHDGVGGSVIVMRTSPEQVKAFANSCRHRGTRLVSGTGKCARIVCPYHSWAYDLDGKLIAAPGMKDVKNFDKVDFPLREFPLQIWQGFLFFNYDRDATPLNDHLGNMSEMFAPHRLDEMVCVRRTKYEINSNWKLLAENSLEAYHTGTVHRETLGQQASVEINAIGNWGGIFICGEESVATMPGDKKPLPHIPGLGKEASQGTYFTMIYPCTQFVMAQDCMWWLSFVPISRQKTRLILGCCFPRSTTELENFSESVKPYFHRWDTATPEDNEICETQQLGQIHHKTGGRYHESEYAVHRLSNWLLDQLSD